MSFDFSCWANSSRREAQFRLTILIGQTVLWCSIQANQCKTSRCREWNCEGISLCVCLDNSLKSLRSTSHVWFLETQSKIKCTFESSIKTAFSQQILSRLLATLDTRFIFLIISIFSISKHFRPALLSLSLLF